MKQRGGYVFKMPGTPSSEVVSVSTPDAYILPLAGPELNFNELDVRNGVTVKAGEVLARDEDCYSLPLISPVMGKVNLKVNPGHITIEPSTEVGKVEIEKTEGVDKLMRLGVWPFIRDVRGECIADPRKSCGVLVMSLTSLEPFASNALAIATTAADRLAGGFAKLAEVLGGPQKVVVTEEGASPAITELAGVIKAAGAEHIVVKARYPFGNPLLVARRNKLGSKTSAVWSVSATGAVAAFDAIESNEFAVSRIITVAGPGVAEPKTVKLLTGHPLLTLVPQDSENPARMISGGVFSGADITSNLGLDTETSAITVLRNKTPRTFMAYLWPNISRRSATNTGLGSLRGVFPENVDAGVLGERRPCVQCGSCVKVCPSGLMPGMLHRSLYSDNIEEAQLDRVDLCIGCGLCSFGCTSKIELTKQFAEAKAEIRAEEEAN